MDRPRETHTDAINEIRLFEINKEATGDLIVIPDYYPPHRNPDIRTDKILKIPKGSKTRINLHLIILIANNLDAIKKRPDSTAYDIFRDLRGHGKRIQPSEQNEYNATLCNYFNFIDSYIRYHNSSRGRPTPAK